MAADAGSEELKISCNPNCLERIREFVRQKATKAGFNQTEVGRLVLAADEASSNIIRHSYHFESDHQIVVVWREGKDRVIVEIQDDSREPYLPSKTDFDLPTKIQYRQTNGYGKYVLSQAIDDLYYETIPGSNNKVSLVKFRGVVPPEHRHKKQMIINPYDSVRTRSISLMNIYDTIEGLNRQKVADDLIHLFLQSVMGQLSTQPVALLSSRLPDQGFRVVGQIGISKRIPVSEISLPHHGWVAETLWAQGGALLGEEFRKLSIPKEELEVLDKLQSTVLIPIFFYDSLRGIVSLGPKRNRRTFSAENIQLISLLSSYTLLLLENLEQSKAGTS